MNTRRHLIFLIITIACISNIYAQFDPKPQIKLPTGDAQSLGKFGEIPVDLHTGRVNINIPVYTVKYYDIEVPISISYHGGGIKVSDECGSVGLGWTLNVGGVVNRIIRGMPDDLLDTSNKVAGFEKLSSLTLTNGLNQFTNFINLIKQRHPERDPTALSDPRGSDELYLADMISKYGTEYDGGHFDTASDNYMFNALGLSGVFVHKGTSDVILQSNDGVTVSRPNSLSYTITDDKGYIYKFQDVERQTYFYKVGYDWAMEDYDWRPEFCFKYPSSWWLSSITSPTGEIITFHYTDAKIVYPRTPFFGYTEVTRRSSTNNFYKSIHGYNNSQTADTLYKKVLNRIETPNSIVRFYYQGGSLFTHSPCLDSLAVFARPESDKAIERVKFSYKGGGTTPKSQLSQLTKYGKHSDEKQSYIFSYLPSAVTRIDDRRIDHWGYFSAFSTGTFPKKTYFEAGVPNGISSISFANRYADNINASNGMLSSIIYPTGGSSEFTWEPHSYSKLSQLGGQSYRDRTNEHEPGIIRPPEFKIEASFSLCGKSANEILSKSYTINSSRTAIIDFSSYYPSMGSFFSCIQDWYAGDFFDQRTIYKRAHVQIKKDGQVIHIVHICAATYQRFVEIDLNSSGDYTFELHYPRESFNLHCGGGGEEMRMFYELFNRYGIDTSQYGYVKIQIGYQTLPSFSGGGYEYANVGGVRIKSIVNRSSKGATVLSKQYDYVEDISDLQSPCGGVLSYYPRYGSLMSFCETVYLSNPGGAGATVTDCPDLLTLRSNGLPYVLNGGGHIEYAKVIESVVKNAGLPSNDPYQETIRRTVYSYWTGADPGYSDIDDTGYGVFIPTDMLQLTSQSYLRGHLKEKTEYTDEYKTSTYQYEILEKPITETITGSIFTVGDYTKYALGYNNGQGGTVKPYKDLGIVQYRVIPYNERLQSVVTEGGKSDDYHAYTYASNTYSDTRLANAPLSHTTVNSEGDTVTQYFTYVNANLNRIHTCVTVKKGKIIDAYRNEYDTQGRIIEKYIALLNPENLPSVNNYNAVSLTNKLVESYLYYNNRMVQLTDHNSDVSTVYLWSYYGTYPVAEIQNATYNEVCNILGTNNVNTLFNASIPDMSILNGTRTALPGCMVSTMTYKLLTGIASFTDPKGATTWYDYNGFGQLKECYIIENGQKKIIQKKEYHWSH